MKDLARISSLCRRSWLAALIVLLPSLAEAHPGVPGHTHGFANGWWHPLSGLDHICAMVAVGLWAAQRGGRALWVVPTVFVSLMTIGGVLGMGGPGIPWVEQGIAVSVLVLGLFVAASIRLPLSLSVAMVGLFGMFHGYAHGAEMPATVSGLAYAAGFVLATVGLHLAGVGLGLAARHNHAHRLVRLAGGVIAAAGVYLCLA